MITAENVFEKTLIKYKIIKTLDLNFNKILQNKKVRLISSYFIQTFE